jgi:hypothetical protein
VVIIIVVPTFAGLCAWQVHRALDGNQLSWAYVFEWPFFAGYAIYMWWRFLHEAPGADRQDQPSDATMSRVLDAGAPDAEAPGAGEPGAGEPDAEAPGAGEPDAEATERAAYNEYLAALATRGRRKQWR